MADWKLELPAQVEEKLDQFMSGQYALPTYGRGSIPESPPGFPSLLLASLEDTERSSAADLELALRDSKESGSRCVVLVGTSGCGKTRTLYSYFWKTFGVYFIVSNVHDGSGDLESLCSRLTDAGLSAGVPTKNGDIVRNAVQLLLAVRLKVLAYCKARHINPQQWLLLQVAAAKRLKNKDGQLMGDIFQDAWEYVWLRTSCMLLACTSGIFREVTQLLTETGYPDVAVDESQVLLHEYTQGYFTSLANGSIAMPLARDVLGGLWHASRTHRVIACGTGLEILSSVQDSLSGLGKRGEQVRGLYPSKGWLTAEEMIEYAEQVLEQAGLDGLSGFEKWLVQHYVFPRFSGRFRPFVTVLELLVMNRQASIAGLAAQVQDMLCRRGWIDVRGYAAAVEEVEQCGVGEQVALKLTATLDDATECYYLNGETFRLRETQQVMRLVEVGIARLRAETSKQTVDLSSYLPCGLAEHVSREYSRAEYVGLLDEHLMFEALLERRGGLPWLMKRAVNKVLRSGFPQGQGYDYQQVVCLALLRLFEQGKALAELPLFKEVLQDGIFREENFRDVKDAVIGLKKGLTHLLLSQPGYGYAQHVAAVGKKGTMMVSSKNEPNPEGVGHGYFPRAQPGSLLHGVSVLLAMQAKYYEAMASRDWEEAWKRALFDWDFMEAMSNCKFQLSFLVAFPCKIGGQPRYKVEERDGKLRMVVVVGLENARELFSESEIDDLTRPKRTKKQEVRKKRKLIDTGFDNDTAVESSLYT